MYCLPRTHREPHLCPWQIEPSPGPKQPLPDVVMLDLERPYNPSKVGERGWILGSQSLESYLFLIGGPTLETWPAFLLLDAAREGRTLTHPHPHLCCPFRHRLHCTSAIGPGAQLSSPSQTFLPSPSSGPAKEEAGLFWLRLGSLHSRLCAQIQRGSECY